MPKSPDPATGSEPASPCVNICVIHPRTGFCAGCLRSMGEITTWSILDAQARQRILDALPAREGLVRKRRRLSK